MGGTLIAISERGLDQAGNLRAFLIGGPAPGTFAIKRIERFDISDAALLPSGDLLILERSLSWPEGLLVQIRRIRIGDIKPGAVVDGPVIFEADLRFEIDNMEGLAVHQTPAGEIVLTLISDDNFFGPAAHRTPAIHFGGAIGAPHVASSRCLCRRCTIRLHIRRCAAFGVKQSVNGQLAYFASRTSMTPSAASHGERHLARRRLPFSR